MFVNLNDSFVAKPDLLNSAGTGSTRTARIIPVSFSARMEESQTSIVTSTMAPTKSGHFGLAQFVAPVHASILVKAGALCRVLGRVEISPRFLSASSVVRPRLPVFRLHGRALRFVDQLHATQIIRTDRSVSLMRSRTEGKNPHVRDPTLD